ncbi:MAG: CheR family methyltransferase [Cyanobacteriota bacterium]|nr:CheR family methyltransferase [Cyanobacteriota bacterium]
MNGTLLQKFIQLIAGYVGLQIREQDYDGLCNKIFVRIRSLKLSGPEQYYQLLKSQNQTSKNEWENLIILLTVTESYFFRDRGQFELLKNVILPEVIKSKEASNEKILKIWSAGCSTGEEPYSLAIIVQELIPNWKDWNILILGTDINEVALGKAREGIYSDWSFRLLEQQIQHKYFYKFQGKWKLEERVKKSVKFNKINLVRDDFPVHIDLILCRNVFVYFEPKSILWVIRKFYNSLNKGGYLMTGHAELDSQLIDKFQVRIFPESLVYQRVHDRQSNNHLADDSFSRIGGNLVPINKSLKSSLINSKSNIYISNNSGICYDADEEILFDLDSKKNVREEINNNYSIESERSLLEAEALFECKAYVDAIKKAEQFINLHPKNFRAYKLLAQLYANLGKYESATFYCNKAIEVNYLSVYPYYLLVNIAEEEGDIKKAKMLLKQIIYLSPQEIPAYLELSSIYEAQQDITRAKKMKNTALELLRKLPNDATVEYKGGIKVCELIKYLEI